MEQEFRRSPSNIKLNVEEMLVFQERDGNCEVGTGQRSNHWTEYDDDNYDDDSKIYMTEMQLLMISVSLKRDAGRVSREVQRLQYNCPSTRSVLKRYKMSYTYYKFRVRNLYAVKSHISAFWTITLCGRLGAYMCNSKEYPA